MARYSTSITTPRRPEEAFEYMAAFDNVAEWDPSVSRAERVGPGPRKLGSRFRVVVSAAGRRLPLDYTIVEIDPPRKVLLVAETPILRSADQITVEPAPGGAKVTYDADLRLRGPLRIFDPVMSVMFKRIGDRAAAGLRARLQAA